MKPSKNQTETITIPQKKNCGPYKIPEYKKTTLNVNNSYEGERIEEKIRRITTNNEPIEDTAPIMYTERKNGVQPEYNIRTDRWEIAIDAMNNYAGSIQAERENRHNPKQENQTSENQSINQ